MNSMSIPKLASIDSPAARGNVLCDRETSASASQKNSQVLSRGGMDPYSSPYIIPNSRPHNPFPNPYYEEPDRRTPRGLALRVAEPWQDSNIPGAQC